MLIVFMCQRNLSLFAIRFLFLSGAVQVLCKNIWLPTPLPSETKQASESLHTLYDCMIHEQHMVTKKLDILVFKMKCGWNIFPRTDQLTVWPIDIWPYRSSMPELKNTPSPPVLRYAPPPSSPDSRLILCSHPGPLTIFLGDFLYGYTVELCITIFQLSNNQLALLERPHCLSSIS